MERRWREFKSLAPEHDVLEPSFAVQKARFLCPFSCPDVGPSSVHLAHHLRMFFERAQVDVIDPIRLVEVLLQSADTTLRFQSYKLGCKILQDAQLNLQNAFVDDPDERDQLRKCFRYEFESFLDKFNGTQHQSNTEVLSILLRFIQHLCEFHNRDLQEFFAYQLEGYQLSLLAAEGGGAAWPANPSGGCWCSRDRGYHGRGRGRRAIGSRDAREPRAVEVRDAKERDQQDGG